MVGRVSFISDGYEIEGILRDGDNTKGIVITHPHPLYGGNMNNHVVEIISSAYQDFGYTTLRFNFRGVGKSQGAYDDGIGEQNDVYSALLFLYEKGFKTLDLAGYSFGNWVNVHTDLKKINLQQVVMVSPPVAFMKFDPDINIKSLKLVITGNYDEIAPVDQVKKYMPNWNPDAVLKVIKGADHFYSGHLDDLKTVLLSEL